MAGKQEETHQEHTDGSDEDFDVFCHACDNSSIRKKADVYCKNCKECFCQNCRLFHMKLTATKDHDLLEMCCKPCANDNTKEEGVVFCKNCEEFLCKRCEVFHGRLTATRSHELLSVMSFVLEKRGAKGMAPPNVYSTLEKKTSLNLPPFTASASTRQNEDLHHHVTIRKTPGTTIGSGETAKYSFQIENMLFCVYKESITEIKGMDTITNAANERLMHGGGVAYYISKAAGKKMDKDCNSYIARNGPLQVTRNYVSVPGGMKCKGIIHAVGPTWYDYTDKKDDCARDLYETIKNILITANNKKWQKVALSAISSGLFGVPKKLCAEMYIKAFADYATEADGTVKEVHFIDVSREILDTVIETHKTWMIDESKLDFRNALEYVPVVGKKQIRRGLLS